MFMAIEECILGVQTVVANAQRLSNDAKIFLENGSHATAAALALLSIEEMGKSIYVLLAGTAEDEKQFREFLSAARRHNAKNGLADLADRLIAGHLTPEKFMDIFSDQNPAAKRLNLLKQAGLYVDWDANRGWLDPMTTVSPTEATSLVKQAQQLSALSSLFHGPAIVDALAALRNTPDQPLLASKVWMRRLHEDGITGSDAAALLDGIFSVPEGASDPDLFAKLLELAAQ